MPVKHAFVSAIADGADATLVRPSNWNADHSISGTLAWDSATVTANTPLLDLSQTWNNSGVNFSAIKLNVTNSASGSGSLLIDLQVGGTSQFKVSPAGVLTVPGGINGTTFGQVLFLGNGGAYSGATLGVGSTNITFRNDTVLQWLSTDQGGIGDATIYREASGILALRNSTLAHSLRVYNTFTDASNYERGVFDWSTTSNQFLVGTQAAGTGTKRDLVLDGGNNRVLVLPTGGTYRALIGYDSPTGFDGFMVRASGGYMWSSGAPDVNSADVLIARQASGVLSVGGATVPGFLQWGGQARVTSDVTFTSTTTLGTVTGLSVNVQAGRTYTFEAQLQVTDAAAGGVKAAIAGTATATAIQYTGWTVADNAIKGKANATALGTTVGSTTTTETSGIVVQIYGTITVNAAGTLLVQAAQNTSSGTATAIKRGSYFYVYDIA